jgi:hypothetical protein
MTRTALALVVYLLLGLLPCSAVAQTAEALAAADRLIAVQNFDALMNDMAIWVVCEEGGSDWNPA